MIIIIGFVSDSYQIKPGLRCIPLTIEFIYGKGERCI